MNHLVIRISFLVKISRSYVQKL